MERPTGVTVLAVLSYIAAGVTVLAALLFFVGGAAFARMGGASRGMGALLVGLGAIAGIVMLGLAALYVAVGLGLWNLRNWARVTAVVLTGIGLLFAAVGVLSGLMHVQIGQAFSQLISGAIDAWIIAYLFKPHVKQAFGA